MKLSHGMQMANRPLLGSSGSVVYLPLGIGLALPNERRQALQLPSMVAVCAALSIALSHPNIKD